MKRLLFLTFICLTPFVVNAKNKKQVDTALWDKIVTTTTTEVYLDSATIVMGDGITVARLKTVYTTPEVRENYIANIKKVFTKNADKKIQRWSDFQYSITTGIYDCVNGRYKILEVSDYDSNNNLIVTTKKKEAIAAWNKTEPETVGDYTLFNICDYESNFIVADGIDVIEESN